MRGIPWEEFLALLAFLGFATAFITQPDFNPEKFCGTWYTAGTAVGNGYTTTEQLDRLTVAAGRGGALIFRSQVSGQNCRTEEVTLSMSEKPGNYKRVVSGKTTSFTVVETDYISFAIMATESADLRVLHLYTRAPEIPQDIREKFKEFVRCARFPDGSVMFHETMGECT